MLMLILLNHLMFIEVMSYLHHNKMANKILRRIGLFTNKAKRAFFNYIVLHCIVFRTLCAY